MHTRSLPLAVLQAPCHTPHAHGWNMKELWVIPGLFPGAATRCSGAFYGLSASYFYKYRNINSALVSPSSKAVIFLYCPKEILFIVHFDALGSAPRGFRAPGLLFHSSTWVAACSWSSRGVGDCSPFGQLSCPVISTQHQDMS